MASVMDYKVEYTSNKCGGYILQLNAESYEEAKEIAKFWNLPNGFVRAQKVSWPFAMRGMRNLIPAAKETNQWGEVLHEANILSYVGLCSGKVSIHEVSCDDGLLHLLAHINDARTLQSRGPYHVSKEIQLAEEMAYDFETRIPGWAAPYLRKEPNNDGIDYNFNKPKMTPQIDIDEMLKDKVKANEFYGWTVPPTTKTVNFERLLTEIVLDPAKIP